MQNTFAQQYNFRNYSVKEGIAQSQVYCMLQDSRGYLWMGTRGGGLTRFDGIKFTTYTTKNGLPNNYILCIKEDQQHNLWIGTNNGLCFYNGNKFENYFPNKNAIIAINEIDIDENQNLWLASSEGLLMFNKSTFRLISSELNDKQHITNSILYLNANKVLYANANGIFTYNSIKKTYSLNKKYTQINCIRKDANNKIWLGTYGMGVFIGDGENFSQPIGNPILRNSIVWNINFDRKNNAWISTLSNGIIEYNLNENQTTILTEREGLSNNHVRCMLQDQSGNYWFGTSGGGVSNYFGKMFTHYDKQVD